MTPTRRAARLTPQGDSTATPTRSPNRLRRVPTSEQVSEHVRRLIFDGELRPGDRIPQDAIAAELGVSRIPVREALIEMARDGLVVNEPHIGAFVGAFDEGVIRDHFDIVAMLQAMAAERLAEHPDPVVMAELRAIADGLPSVVDDLVVHEQSVQFQRVVNHGGGSSRQRAGAARARAHVPVGGLPRHRRLRRRPAIGGRRDLRRHRPRTGNPHQRDLRRGQPPSRRPRRRASCGRGTFTVMADAVAGRRVVDRVGRVDRDPADRRRPDLELVGVWVHSPDKVGRDAGDARRPRPDRA